HRAEVPRAPGIRQTFPYELVIWFIRTEGLPQPILEMGCPVYYCEHVTGEQLAPLHGPEIGVLRAFEQTIDQPRPLPRRSVRKEPTCFICRRHDANHIQVNSP